jgi:hypothetical protein
MQAVVYADGYLLARGLFRGFATSDIRTPAQVTPAPYTTNAWGNMVWGKGPEEALAKIGTRSAGELRGLGLNVRNATQLRNFYLRAEARGEGGATASARVQLMNDIIKTLKAG